MKLFAAAIAVAIMPTTASAADSLAECYEIAILECGLVWGGKDWGDENYKNCINDQFDICDILFDAQRGGNDSFKTPQSTKPPRLKSG
jgi:hypothetical protein